MSLVDFEVEEINKLCENAITKSKIIACNTSLIRVHIQQTKVRQLAVCLRFPANYPKECLLIELISKTLSPKFLCGLAEVSERHAKELLGKPQTFAIIKFIAQYLNENPLCVVFDEIFEIRKSLLDINSEVKLKQKTCSLILNIIRGNYYFKIKPQIPSEYPSECIYWNHYESNLPLVLIRYLNGQAKEIARRCVEPPLSNKNKKILESFQPQPSLKRTLKFLIDATSDFCKELCPVCCQQILPLLPEDVIVDDTMDMYIERVYCGHLFHQGCLKQYMHEPPFTPGGKLCPASKVDSKTPTLRLDNVEIKETHDKHCKSNNSFSICGIRLAHDRWVVNNKIAEARWAQKQARARELEEVMDFLK